MLFLSRRLKGTKYEKSTSPAEMYEKMGMPAGQLLSPRDEKYNQAYEWLFSLHPEYTKTEEPFPTGTFNVYQSLDNENLVFKSRDETVIHAEQHPTQVMFREWSIDVVGDDRCAEPPVQWSVARVYKPRLCQAAKGLARWGESSPEGSAGHRYILKILSPDQEKAQSEGDKGPAKKVAFEEPAENFLDDDERLPSNIGLTHAVAKGTPHDVREFLKSHRAKHSLKETAREVNLADAAGWTPLMKAAARGVPEMVADLLLAGALKEPQYPTGEVPRYQPKTACELAQARSKSEPHITCARLLGPKVSTGVVRAFQAADYAFKDGMEPDWIQNEASWTKDDDAFRSGAKSDDDTPASNVLKDDDTVWATGKASDAAWLVLDLGEVYELDKVEIHHPVDVPETPQECEFQFAVGKDVWKTVARFVCSQSKPQEEIEFEPTKATRWRLLVNRSYGTGEQGAQLSKVRLHGRPASTDEEPEPELDRKSESVTTEGQNPESPTDVPEDSTPEGEAAGSQGSQAAKEASFSPVPPHRIKRKTDSEWNHYGGGLRGLFGEALQQVPMPQGITQDRMLYLAIKHARSLWGETGRKTAVALNHELHSAIYYDIEDFVRGDSEQELSALEDNKYVGKWQQGWHVYIPPLDETRPPSKRAIGTGVLDPDADMIADEGEAEIEQQEEGLDPNQADPEDPGPPTGNWRDGGKLPCEFVILEDSEDETTLHVQIKVLLPEAIGALPGWRIRTKLPNGATLRNVDENADAVRCGFHQVDVKANSVAPNFGMTLDLSRIDLEKEDYVPSRTRMWAEKAPDEDFDGTVWELDLRYVTAFCKTTAASSSGEQNLIVKARQPVEGALDFTDDSVIVIGAETELEEEAILVNAERFELAEPLKHDHAAGTTLIQLPKPDPAKVLPRFSLRCSAFPKLCLGIDGQSCTLNEALTKEYLRVRPGLSDAVRLSLELLSAPGSYLAATPCDEAPKCLLDQYCGEPVTIYQLGLLQIEDDTSAEEKACATFVSVELEGDCVRLQPASYKEHILVGFQDEEGVGLYFVPEVAQKGCRTNQEMESFFQITSEATPRLLAAQPEGHAICFNSISDSMVAFVEEGESFEFELRIGRHQGQGVSFESKKDTGKFLTVREARLQLEPAPADSVKEWAIAASFELQEARDLKYAQKGYFMLKVLGQEGFLKNTGPYGHVVVEAFQEGDSEEAYFWKLRPGPVPGVKKREKMTRKRDTIGIPHPGFHFLTHGGETPEKGEVDPNELPSGRIFRAYDPTRNIKGEVLLWSDPTGTGTYEGWDVFGRWNGPQPYPTPAPGEKLIIDILPAGALAAVEAKETTEDGKGPEEKAADSKPEAFSLNEVEFVVGEATIEGATRGYFGIRFQYMNPRNLFGHGKEKIVIQLRTSRSDMAMVYNDGRVLVPAAEGQDEPRRATSHYMKFLADRTGSTWEVGDVALIEHQGLPGRLVAPVVAIDHEEDSQYEAGLFFGFDWFHAIRLAFPPEEVDWDEAVDFGDWQLTPGQLAPEGNPLGVIMSSSEAVFREPFSPCEVFKAAIEFARKLKRTKGCIAFAMHPKLGVKWFDKERFLGSGAYVDAAPEQGWQTWSDGEPPKPKPHDDDGGYNLLDFAEDVTGQDLDKDGTVGD